MGRLFAPATNRTANTNRARGRDALPGGDRRPQGTVGLIDEAKT
jgi:hypothetical protein